MFESLHISRRLDVAPQELVEAAGRWHRRLHQVRVAPRVLRAAKGFWLNVEAITRKAEFVEQYEVRGVLWTRGRPVRVIVQFSKFSDTQSEVGITPCTTTWPVGTVAYEGRVRSALLALELEVRTPAYLADVPARTARSETPALVPGMAR